MLPAEHALSLYAGDTFSASLRFSEAGQPVDLSGWSSWRASWRGKLGEPLEEFGVDASRAGEGIVTLTLTPTQTRRMSERGSWDLQAQRDGVTRTWVRGRTSWTNDVTPGGDE